MEAALPNPAPVLGSQDHHNRSRGIQAINMWGGGGGRSGGTAAAAAAAPLAAWVWPI